MSTSLPYQVASSISKSAWFVKRNFNCPKSFSFAYLKYRLLRPVLKLYYKSYKLINPPSPWTTQASIKTFKMILNRSMIGFEYGSGNSTIFFAGRLKRLVSIEHNSEWHHVVNNWLRKKKINNVDYQFIPQNESSKNNFSFYEDYQLSKSDFQIRSEYSNYFSYINKFDNDYFDFIIVDGRARVECSLNAIPKLKKGGIFVLDNSDRDRYKPVFKVLNNWDQVTTTTGLFDTTIWFKPSN